MKLSRASMKKLTHMFIKYKYVCSQVPHACPRMKTNTQLTFLSFLYHVRVARGFPPEDIQDIFCTVPTAMLVPSEYPCIIG